ncbi:MAG: galactose-1-phosphate uridylyltransferase, partial [Desulfuromonadaceae bacterium]
PHSHSQVIAVPIMPVVVASELSVSRDYYLHKERCLICDLIEEERQRGQGIVQEDDDYIVFTPYASCFPFELRIAPLRHSHDFGALDDEALARLADTLKDTLLRLRTLLRDPPYNFVLHSAPPMHPRLGKPGYWSSLSHDYHWHIELVPRLTRIAGFEWGTGFYMNPTPPEDAARFLRETDLSVFR